MPFLVCGQPKRFLPRSGVFFLSVCVDSPVARFFFSSPEWSPFSFCVCGQPGGTAFLCGLPGPSPGEGRTGGTETPLGSEDPIFGKTLLSWLFA